MASEVPITTGAAATRFYSPVDIPASPYYLHPSEGPGLVLVSQPLTGDNYIAWSKSFQMAITIKNKLGFLDGSIAQPDQDSPILYNAWVRNNNLVFSWLYNSLSKDIQASVLFTTSAKEIWDKLGVRFSENNGPRQFQIRKDLANLAQNDLTITHYYTKLKSLWDELIAFKPVCCCGNCSCGGVVKLWNYQENELVLCFLMGLSENYSNTRSQILLMDPLPSINKVFSMLVQEERQKIISTNPLSSGNMFTLAVKTDPSKRNV